MIETTIDFSATKGGRSGFVWGFKDWQNYNYFVVAGKYFWIGSVYEGVQIPLVEEKYSITLKPSGMNTIKIFVGEEHSFFSINGEIQARTTDFKLFGNMFGYIAAKKSTITIDNLIVKESGTSIGSSTTEDNIGVKSTGTGLIISTGGYIVTNWHVVEDSKSITVDVNHVGGVKSYPATIVQKDEQNDLAILKISDSTFKMNELKYCFSENGNFNVGASVFAIGYPHALTGMGVEAKFVDGKVSSKTGFNNSVNSFQTSIPVQPGNSGSPVFNEKGELLGIVNASYASADNVSYIIKLHVLKNLISLLPEELPVNQNKINTISLEEKIKVLLDYIVLIKVK